MAGAWHRLSAGVLLIAAALSAHAEIVIDRTRVIYTGGAREVTVNLKNEADGPRLVQLWIDQGDVQREPEVTDVPFTITPPITRMDAGKGAALRLFFNATGHEPLPTDRESLFWLNVLGIPPSGEAQEDTAGQIHFAFRTRIKLFLRPASLRPAANEAPGALQWRAAGDSSVHVTNPGPYHVTLTSITWAHPTGEFSTDDPPMLGPFASATVPLSKTGNAPPSKQQLAFTTLDDLGNTQSHQAVVAARK